MDKLMLEDLADRIHRITGHICDMKELRYIAGTTASNQPYKESDSQEQIDAWTDKREIPLNTCDHYTKISGKDE